MIKTISGSVLGLLLMLVAQSAAATLINATFADAPFSPVSTSAVTITADYNQWFSDNYDFTVSDAYLYYDGRDTFDGVGIASNSTSPGGTVLFNSATDSVSVDWVAFSSDDIFIEAYNTFGLLVDSYYYDDMSAVDNVGSATLSGVGISKLVFHDSGGYVTLSTITYMSGDTGGGIGPGPLPVPAPAVLLLIAGGLLGLGLSRRR